MKQFTIFRKTDGAWKVDQILFAPTKREAADLYFEQHGHHVNSVTYRHGVDGSLLASSRDVEISVSSTERWHKAIPKTGKQSA